MTDPPVLLHIDGPIAIITLNRPGRLNAIVPELSEAYVRTLERVRRDDTVRVAIVTGAGRAFCSGADLKARVEKEEEQLANFYTTPQTPTQALYTAPFEKPLIAAVHGYCLGGGMEIAMTCDLRIATNDSIWGLPDMKRGFFPGGGGPVRLPRLIPQALAMEMLMTGDLYEAERMREWGLVNRVVSPERLMAETMNLAARIAKAAPLAMSAMKELVYTSLDMPLPQAMRHAASQRWIIGQTEDAKEGPRAFVAKREPEFRGS